MYEKTQYFSDFGIFLQLRPPDYLFYEEFFKKEEENQEKERKVIIIDLMADDER